MLLVMKDLKVIDTIVGARMESQGGDTVFILIPRHEAIPKMTNAKQIIASLHAPDDVKSKSDVRGRTRIPVAENNGKYAIELCLDVKMVTASQSVSVVSSLVKSSLARGC